MARLDCYSKPIHISVPTTSYHLCSEYYLSESEPADFDKEAVDLKIQELADLLFDCDDIYSNCETVDSEIIDFFSMDDNPLDIFDIDLCSNIMFKIKDISKYGIEHLKERTSEVENGINDIKMWLNSLYLNGLVANPKDQDGVYTYLNSDTVFDYGSWVPKRK